MEELVKSMKIWKGYKDFDRRMEEMQIVKLGELRKKKREKK